MGGRLDGKVALITGATGGIGAALVRRFSDEGAQLIVAGTRSDYEVPSSGAVYRPGDVTSEDYVRSLVQSARDRFGRLDILVNAHGVDYHSDLMSTPIDEAERVIQVNLVGALTTMKHALPLLIESGAGSIVNIASRLGIIAIPGQAVYSATKGGLIMLSRGAAIDYARHHVRVNCVAPGITATPMIDRWVASQPDSDAFAQRIRSSIPLGRMAQPEDVANATVFLASDEADYITGVVLPVDGGYTAA